MDSPPFGTTIVFLDFTHTSLNALASAVMLSHRLGTSLHLLTVCVPTQTTAAEFGESDRITNDELNKEAAKVQQLATTISQEHSIVCTVSCRNGYVPEEVVAEAEECQAKLIIMGLHTGPNIQAFRTSDDAYQVITKTVCPVLTIPDHKKWDTFINILFPVRPIPFSLDKYDFARQLVRQTGVMITVLALFPPGEIISREHLKDELARLSANLTQDEIRSQTLLCESDNSAETVLAQATAQQADLLIITARLATTSENFFIGPFTQQIIHTAQLPVLAIRPESSVHSMTT